LEQFFDTVAQIVEAIAQFAVLLFFLK